MLESFLVTTWYTLFYKNSGKFLRLDILEFSKKLIPKYTGTFKNVPVYLVLIVLFISIGYEPQI